MANRKLHSVLAFIVVVIFFAQGCAGRAARPIKVTQPSDVKKTCNEIRYETKKNRRNLTKHQSLLMKPSHLVSEMCSRNLENVRLC